MMAVLMRSPRTGTFKKSASRFLRPLSVKIPSRTAMTTSATTAAITYQSLTTKFAIPSSILVGRGSFAVSEAKNVLNLGRTKPVMTTTATMARQKTMAGYMRADDTLRRASMSRSM